MSTILEAVFILVSGNVYFAIVIFEIYGLQMRLSASSQNSITEKSRFGLSRVIFLNA